MADHRKLRIRLLVTASVLAAPAAAHAQTTVTAAETASRSVSGAQTLTIASTGSIVTSGSQSVNINGNSTGSGVVITNNGLLQGSDGSATANNGRGISSSGDYADRTATITNNANVIGSNDAIRFAPTTTLTAATGTIAIVNSGTIQSTGLYNGAVVQSGQGVEDTVLGTSLVITNRAGGTISGSQGILSAGATTTIDNFGTITGTAAGGTQGEAIRTNLVTGASTGVGTTLSVTNEANATISGVYGIIGTGPSNIIVNRGTISGNSTTTTGTSGTITREAIRLNAGVTANQVNTVTLASGSTTTAGTGTGATGAAVTFGGTVAAGFTMTNTLNVETGSTISGTLAGSGQAAATDTLNLTGTGSQVLVPATGFEVLNVQGGTWGITNSLSIANSVTIASGATLRYDDAGTSGGSLSGAAPIANNGTLVDNRTSTVTQGSAISGTGGVQVVNTGTLVFTTGNSYSGATLISNGRLRTGQLANSFSANSAVTVTGQGILDLNDNTVDAGGVSIPVARYQTIANLSGDGTVRLGQLNSATLTTGSGGGDTVFSGTLTQLGGLTKVGSGQLTLSGDNTATGALTVSGGSVALSGSWAGDASLDSGTMLSGGGNIAGTLSVADAAIAPGNNGLGTLTVGGLALSSGSALNYQLGAPGTGDRIQVNGNLTLDGMLNISDVGGFGAGVYRLIDYSGALTDNGLLIGSVPPGTNSNLMTIQTSIASQVNLVYSGASPVTMQFWDGANVTANGRVDGGNGSWNNSLANWTTANGASNIPWAGVFGVFQGTAGTVTVDDAITFTGAQFMTDGYVIAAGRGSLTTNTTQTNLRVDPGVTATINVAIGGTGGITKLDSGTLVLGGANTYGGATTVAGGVLRAGAGGALPTGTAVTIASGATLDIGAAQTIASLAGDGAVTLSGGGLTTGGANTDTRFGGAISGSGGLTKTGTGTFTLSGANGYTGGTVIAAGTLRLDGGTIGAGDLSVASGATFDINGGAAAVAALSGGGSILLGSGTLTSGGTADSNFGGVISGSGGLIKTGTGTLTLSGANSYTGTTAIRAGILTLGAGALPTAATVAISSGATLALGGATTLGMLNGAGNVALGASTMTVGAGSYGGVIGGSGGLVKAGSDMLTLTGAETYTGATTISGGTLAIGAGGSIASSSGVSLAGGTRLDLSAASAQTVKGLDGVSGSSVVLGTPALTVNNTAESSFAGVISGSGGLIKTGTGTLTLSGANTYSGGTTITAGTLATGAANALGAGAVTVTAPGSLSLGGFSQTVASIAGNGAIALGSATLTVNGTVATTYDGVLSGTGGLTRAGGGTLTLTSANTYTGATNITGGTLVVNGSLAGAVTIGAQGRLGGVGRVGALTVNGTVAPGNSIGTLNVAGALTFGSGSTYLVEVTPGGTSDMIVASGAVTLQGGNVSVLTGGQTAFNTLTTYTILTGASVSGTFAGVTTDLAFLTPSLIYNAANVQLRLIRNDVDLAAVAQTGNQRAVAVAVGARTSGAVFDNVLVLNASDARNAFDQLSGEAYVAGATIAGRDTHAAARGILDRLDSTHGKGVQAWVQGDFDRSNADASDGFAQIRSNRHVIEGGIEYGGEHVRGGVAYRYAKSDISLPSRGSDADLTTNGVFAYLGYDAGALRIAGGAGLSWHDLSVRRTVAYGGFSDATRAHDDGQSVGGFGELAFLPRFGGLRAGPYLGVSVARTTLDETQETGGAAALRVGKSSVTTSLGSYGLRGTGAWGGFKLTADVGGRTYLGDRAGTRSFGFVGSDANFEVGAASFDRTALTGRLDASVMTGRIVLGVSFRGETAKNSSNYGARVSAGLRF